MDWRELERWWRGEAQLEARRERDTLLAAIDRLSLPTADAAVAKLTGRPPVGSLDGAAYTTAFVGLYEGWRFGSLTLEPGNDPRGDIVGYDDDGVGVRATPLAVVPDDRNLPSAQSLAHAVLLELLTASEAVALADRGNGWRPEERTRGIVPPLPLIAEPFALDERSRAWAIVGSAVLVPTGVLFLAGSVAVFLTDGDMCAASFALFWGALATWFGVTRLAEVFFREPFARRAALDHRGLFDEVRGRRVEWASVRGSSGGPRSILLVLEEGRQVRLPRSAYRDPDQACLAIHRAIRRRGADRYR